MAEELAGFRRLRERLSARWPEFRQRRRDRLVQAQRFGHAAERVAENILEDLKRLPKAIGALLSNYRGAQVTTVPEPAVPDVLLRLGWAARTAGRMPGQASDTAPAYAALARALEQLGRLGDLDD